MWPLGRRPTAASGVAAPRDDLDPAGDAHRRDAEGPNAAHRRRRAAREPIELAGFYIDEFAYPNEAGAIPKTGMTRDEAAGLCAAQDKRLCTELEWERACKGPSNTTYEYGDSYRAAECTMGRAGRLAPSGLRVACKSAFGVHDLHGGPWEWTASVWRRGGDSHIGGRAWRQLRSG